MNEAFEQWGLHAFPDLLRSLHCPTPAQRRHGVLYPREQGCAHAKRQCAADLAMVSNLFNA
jgi:hypothetical protein